MMMNDNKSFLFVILVALLSTITATPDASRGKRRKPKYSKLRSKFNKKTTPLPIVSPTVSPTTKSPSFNPTPPNPTKTLPSALHFTTELNVFGDSLSDTGNGNQYFPCTETYCGQRFCNGPVVIELISDVLELGPVVAATKPDATNPFLPIPNMEVEGNTNWAFVSASANTEEIKPGTAVKNDFDFQLDLYQGYLAAKQGTTTPSIEATTLQVVFFGGNDVREAAVAPIPIDFLKLSVLALVTNIQTLANMGACSFVVVGPPDLSSAPIVGSFLLPDQIAALKGLSDFFSQTLEAALTQITISNTDSKCFGVQFIDFYTTSNELVNSEEFQTKYPNPLATCNSRFVVPCTTCNEVLTKIGLPPLDISETGGCNCPVPVTSETETKLDCTGIPFYDELHSTAALNELFTQLFLTDLGVVVDDNSSGEITISSGGC